LMVWHILPVMAAGSKSPFPFPVGVPPGFHPLGRESHIAGVVLERSGAEMLMDGWIVVNPMDPAFGRVGNGEGATHPPVPFAV
jgi:hypothetical protein